MLTFLARKRLLLVLDNCEHLIAATGDFAKAVVQSCPQVTVLATSRQILGTTGEATFAVPSLSVPDEVTTPHLALSEALPFEGIALFVDRARAAESRFTLSEENAPIVADICRPA